MPSVIANENVISFRVETIGDDLDFTSYVYDSNGKMIDSLNWGFSHNSLLTDEEIITLVLCKKYKV